MTRKRFIKLMMAKGSSRNEAQALCGWVLECGSYAQAYYELNRPSKLSDVSNAIKAIDISAAIKAMDISARQAVLAFMSLAGEFYRTLAKKLVEG